MSAACLFPTGITLNRRILSISVLLASAIVIAQEGQRLQISTDEGALLTDEIYEQAEGWRKPPMMEDPWRAPEPEPKSRVHFGYDSAYEEQRMRRSGFDETRHSNLREPTPSTLFRLEFDRGKRTE